MNILPLINPLEDLAISLEMFISKICKNKTSFSNYEEIMAFDYSKEHPILSKIFKILWKPVSLLYFASKQLRKFNFLLFPVGNVIKSSILPRNDEVPFNVKFLYLNFEMLKEYVKTYHIERINIADSEDEKWYSDEQFEKAYELSNEVMDLVEWWDGRKQKPIEAGVDDVTMRIEEDQMLIRLAKIRHRIWWSIG
jgi:hypothetical protein